MPSFADLGVPPTLCAAFTSMGYAEPTEVQARAIPPLVAGKDVLLEAQTGSGKTAAFAVPSVLVGSRGPGLRVLVLVPTRALARQVADEVRAVGAGSPFRGVAVTGGVAAEQEERTLGGDVRCVVATPGRLLALVEKGTVRLDKVELVVLDEADRMLDMGFAPDVERVLEATPARQQTVLTSATLPGDVRRLAARHLRDPVSVHVGAKPVPAALEHHRLNVFEEQKRAALVGVLRKEQPERAIVFVRTRNRADAFWKLLKEAGFSVDRLQGEMTHDQRRHVFDLFSRGVAKVLVATDVAGRGLDVPEIDLVVNLDLPEEDEQYVHRAGRAGRMGRPGRVINLVLPSEKERRERLERVTGATWAPYRFVVRPEDDPASREAKELAAKAKAEADEAARAKALKAKGQKARADARARAKAAKAPAKAAAKPREGAHRVPKHKLRRNEADKGGKRRGPPRGS